MEDKSCIAFLQWALPRLHLRWQGIRKVRRQVCKRIDRRIALLHLDSVQSYAVFLDKNPPEWTVLDRLCRVTISRFYRDQDVFLCLESKVLPSLVQTLVRNGKSVLRMWSAGCASGEESYTMAILWHCALRLNHRLVRFEIIATDIDPEMIERAKKACYPSSSIRNMPKELAAQAFTRKNDLFCLHPGIRQYVRFALMDIREQSPAEKVHLLFCRNLAFTYFDSSLQGLVFRKLRDTIEPGGALVLGKHEAIPHGASDFAPWADGLPIYRKL
jgi:chemotaxis protein methyltransferase CheR